MRIRIRRTLAALAAAAGLAAGPAVALSASPPAAAVTPHSASARRPAAVIGRVIFDRLPAGLGSSSAFSYQFGRVDFTSRVWESGSDQDGWRVDLDILVMRGARLRSGRALHDWFIRYERRAGHPHYLPVRVHGHPGWLYRDQLFWLMRPGLAVSIQVDGRRWGTWAVVRTAWAAHERPRCRSGH